MEAPITISKNQLQLIRDSVDLNLGEPTAIYNLGDAHAHGKVSLVHFSSDTKLIIKPRCCVGELLLYQVEDLVFSFLGLKPNNPKVFSIAKSFSAVEYCAMQSKDKIALEEYFFACGVKASILFCLGATDISYENVVVYHNCPVIIDAETLFSPETINLDAHVAYWNSTPFYYSLSRSGFLPSNHIFSPILSQRQAKLLEETAPDIYSKLRLFPYVAEHNIKHIFSGFMKGTYALNTAYSNGDVAKIINVHSNQLNELRIILRPTRLYMDWFKGTVNDQIFLNDELKQLRAGFIPYFTFKTLDLEFDAYKAMNIFAKLLDFAQANVPFLKQNLEKILV